MLELRNSHTALPGMKQAARMPAGRREGGGGVVAKGLVVMTGTGSRTARVSLKEMPINGLREESR